MSVTILNYRFPTWFSLLVLLTLISSCKEEEEGCTDIAATNWSSIADKSCESCCSYPDLQLTFTHAYADTTFKLGDPYTDDFDNVFSVSSLKYYLSDMTYYGEGEAFRVSDSITASAIVSGVSSTVSIGDDVVLVTLGVSTATVGSIRANGEFVDSITFELGVAQLLNSIDPNSVPNTHPLSETTNDLYFDSDSGYIFQRLVIIPDTAVTDTLTLEIGGDDLLQSLTLPLEQRAVAGFDLSIPINVDYKCWFTGINFAADTEEIIKEKIVSNIAKSFSVSD